MTSSPKVLLVEDNELNRDVLSRRLSSRGFSIDIAVDGLQAVKVAHENRPDIILMDLSLPILDGWQATANLRMSHQTRDIPIVALTAHAMAGDKQKALDAGCDDYDTKPVNLPRLLEKISRLLPDNPFLK